MTFVCQIYQLPVVVYTKFIHRFDYTKSDPGKPGTGHIIMPRDDATLFHFVQADRQLFSRRIVIVARIDIDPIEIAVRKFLQLQGR